MMVATALKNASRELCDAVESLRFSAPVTHVYNPLVYARELHEQYLERYANSTKRIVFMGMNPGPWGMAQTGIPFGEVAAVRDFMGLAGTVDQPAASHPKRPVMGMDCPRSEVSGRRLWGAFAARYGRAEDFFDECLVLNYCPLSFMEESGKNRTPDKLPKAEREPLEAACDEHLLTCIRVLEPDWVVGVGRWAREKAERVLAQGPARIGQVLHPSPASPAANRGWSEAAWGQLAQQGILA